jgi:hypothetical protein
MEIKNRHVLLRTSEKEALEVAQKALSKYQNLNSAGFFWPGEKNYLVKLKANQGKEAKQIFNLQEIAACCDFLKRLTPGKKFYAGTSYGFKHQVEHWIEARGGPHLYIGNGSFIAAAVGLGFKSQPCGINSEFNISAISLRKARDEKVFRLYVMEDQLRIRNIPLALISLIMEYAKEVPKARKRKSEPPKKRGRKKTKFTVLDWLQQVF